MTGWPQKGKVSRSIGHNADRHSLSLRPSIKHRPNVAQIGCAEQSNPFDALQITGVGNQTQAQTGEEAQEANAFGKAEGYADASRVYGKARVLDEQGSYTCTCRRCKCGALP